VPKFFFIFKRAGQRVIINKRGDLIVRPSFLEINMIQTSTGLRLLSLDAPQIVAEMSGIRLVLFGMQNRGFGTYSTSELLRSSPSMRPRCRPSFCSGKGEIRTLCSFCFFPYIAFAY
jgi:hypothetical protein